MNASNVHNALVRLLLDHQQLKDIRKDDGAWLALLSSGLCVRTILHLYTSGEVNAVGSKDSNRQSELLLAASHGQESLPKLLLANSFESNDSCYYIVLLWACQSGHEARVKLVLDIERVDVIAEGCEGRTSLVEAFENDHEAKFKLLLGNGRVDVNFTDGFS